MKKTKKTFTSTVGSYTVSLSIEAWHHVQVLDQSMQIQCYLVWIILLVAEDTGFYLVRSFGGSSQACLWHMVWHVDVPQQVLDIVTCCAILYHPFRSLTATERSIFCKQCGSMSMWPVSVGQCEKAWIWQNSNFVSWCFLGIHQRSANS